MRIDLRRGTARLYVVACVLVNVGVVVVVGALTKDAYACAERLPDEVLAHEKWEFLRLCPAYVGDTDTRCDREGRFVSAPYVSDCSKPLATILGGLGALAAAVGLELALAGIVGWVYRGFLSPGA